ncbi:uncharacterized protein Sfp84E [Drosophila bipectinata]|uniref:uncharacterized protein Sfp84E n=1 Tax=Drosophila bipectinata TaxID=42026 RepID=UPI0038B33D12
MNLCTCISIGMASFLLLLPCGLEAKSKEKHFILKARTNQTTTGNATTSVGGSKLSNGNLLEAFYNHCENIYREKDFDANVIKGMASAIMDRLHEMCVYQPIHPLVLTTFTETLYCGGKLSDAIENIENILFGQLDQTCKEKHGFKAYYVTISADNIEEH